jgi:hypothetical protein
MLRPLQVALAEWTPRPLAPGDPVTAIGAAWPQIVGAGVAEHSRPAALNGGSLLVVTRSSSWSQQLALLSGEVLKGLQALPEGRAVQRLRFRVGIVRRARRAAIPAASTPARRARAGHAQPPAADAAEALRRLRDRVARRRRAQPGACAACGAPHAGGGTCAPCAEAQTATRKTATLRLMYEAPWLGFAEISRLAGGVGRAEYEHWRRALLARWWEMLLRAAWSKRATTIERRIGSSYVLLQSQLEPHRITPAVVRNLLGDDIAALLYEQRG